MSTEMPTITLDRRINATMYARLFGELVSIYERIDLVNGERTQDIIDRLRSYPSVIAVRMSYGPKIDVCEIEIEPARCDYESIIRAHKRGSMALALAAIAYTYLMPDETTLGIGRGVVQLPGAWFPGDEIPEY